MMSAFLVDGARQVSAPALLVRGPALVLELLRYDHELRKPADFDLPAQGSKQMHIAPAELKMAERLVHEMEAPFKPGDFKDSYRDDLMALIKRKVKTGDTEESDRGLDEELAAGIHFGLRRGRGSA